MVSIRPGIAMGLSSAVLLGASTPLPKALLGTLDPWLPAGGLYLDPASASARITGIRTTPGDPAGALHAHVHAHARLIHRHPHYPDLHHRHAP